MTEITSLSMSEQRILLARSLLRMRMTFFLTSTSRISLSKYNPTLTKNYVIQYLGGYYTATCNQVTMRVCVCVCVEMMDGRMNDGWMKRQINELAD